MVRIKRTSMLSGKTNYMLLSLSQDEFEQAMEAYHGGQLLQDAFSMLTDAEREFVKTGITPEEWDEMCSEDEVD